MENKLPVNTVGQALMCSWVTTSASSLELALMCSLSPVRQGGSARIRGAKKAPGMG